MQNEKNLSQQPVKFTDLADSEIEQISGGDKFINVAYPFAYYGGFGYGGGGGYGGYGGYGGGGRGKKKGHYK